MLRYCAATSKRSRKPWCFEALFLGPGSAPWSGLFHWYEGNKFARNMHVPFTFCSLVLKAESSLFEAHIWPKKGFQKQERRTWRFVRFHTPRTICFYWTCSKCASDKIALENFHKFAFTSKEPFLCNMFALDFISWLISWQRGLYAENNFFKMCPFWPFFWASSFGTKFVLLEAYTWSNKIYLNWHSKEEYVCLTR